MISNYRTKQRFLHQFQKQHPHKIRTLTLDPSRQVVDALSLVLQCAIDRNQLLVAGGGGATHQGEVDSRNEGNSGDGASGAPRAGRNSQRRIRRGRSVVAEGEQGELRCRREGDGARDWPEKEEEDEEEEEEEGGRGEAAAEGANAAAVDRYFNAVYACMAGASYSVDL
jgi:hypothetical protein